jgi:hypothetical protein
VAQFEVVRHTHLDPEDAWARLTDWERHGQFIPFTTVTLTGIIREAVGAGFVARTRLGPLHFDDPMDVTVWQPPERLAPGVCEIVKRGRVVTGWARLTVTPAQDGSVVDWVEDAKFRLAGPLLNLPKRVAGRRVFGRLVDGLLSDDPAA